MGLSYWALIGALAGAALGYFNYRVIVGVVEARLRALDKSANAAEREAFERKIVLLRQIFFTLEIGILAIVGYVVGSWLGE
jgi:hypothetical protein